MAGELIDRLRDITGGGSAAGVKGGSSFPYRIAHKRYCAFLTHQTSHQGRTFPTALDIGSRLASGGVGKQGGAKLTHYVTFSSDYHYLRGATTIG